MAPTPKTLTRPSLVRPALVQKKTAKAVSLAAPVGGWNARDALAAMDKHDAVFMENLWPSTTDVVARYGFSNFCNGLGAQVETLMPYSSGTASKMFSATAAGNLYAINASGLVQEKYIDCPGAAADYVSTPHSAAITITSDIDIRVLVAADDWTPSVRQSAIEKFTPAASGYILFINADGTLGLLLGNGGAGAVDPSTEATGFENGTAHWIRATWRESTDEVTYYTSDANDGVNWTQLGDVVTGNGSLVDSGGALRVAAEPTGLSGSSDALDGKVYRALLYSGINGALVAEMNADDGTVGSGTFVSSTTGETWTCNGAAAVTAGPLADLTGLGSGRWQYANFTTSADSYLCMVNGVDAYQVYDGTNWHEDGDGSPYDITGVDSEELIGINVFKNRLWFVQTGTLKAWYLPVNAIGGAASSLDMSSLCTLGGYLMAMGTWTIDAGYGVDDYAVWVTSEGEVLVWRMTDPTSASSISLIGVWRLGTPIGRRCFFKYAGDLLLICQDGVVPLSSALQSSRLNPKVSLTDKIQRAMSEAVALYGNNFGWQLEHFAKENQLYLNVPKTLGDQQQYVMNSITKNWCNFSGWPANCFAIFNDDLYFGGNGVVCKAWDTLADNGEDIEVFGLQAFSYWGNATSRKRVTMMRPTVYTDGSPTVGFCVNYDFDQTDRTTSASFSATGSGIWDSSLWDAGIWGGSPTVQRNWQGTTGNGYAIAPSMSASVNGIALRWVATDMVIEPGGML